MSNLTPLRNTLSIFSFKGKSKRLPYFFILLFFIFLNLILPDPDSFYYLGIYYLEISPLVIELVLGVIFLALSVIALAATIRRGRDIGLNFVVTAGMVILIFWFYFIPMLVMVFTPSDIFISPAETGDETWSKWRKLLVNTAEVGAITLLPIGLLSLFIDYIGMFITFGGCTIPVDIVLGDTCLLGSLGLSLGASLGLTLFFAALAAVGAFILNSIKTKI